MPRGSVHRERGVDRLRVSLSAKILLVVFVAVALTSTLAGVVSYRAERREILDTAASDSRELSQMVESVLHAAMSSHEAGGCADLLAGLRGLDDVATITIYDGNGQPVFGDPGPSLSADGQAALVEGRTEGTPARSGDGSVYRSFRLIRLEPACFSAGCHGADDPIAGAVQVDLRTDDVAARLNRESDQAIYLGLGLAVVLVPLLWLVLGVSVVRPLRVFAARATVDRVGPTLGAGSRVSQGRDRRPRRELQQHGRRTGVPHRRTRDRPGQTGSLDRARRRGADFGARRGERAPHLDQRVDRDSGLRRRRRVPGAGW